ncbi:hypothetical protein J3E68DRAFT_135381 [Trichoderma sp. SZMC 28012]
MRTMSDSQYSFSCLAIMFFLLEHDCCFWDFINMLSPLFNLPGEYGVDIMLDEKKRRNGLVLFILVQYFNFPNFPFGSLCLWCILPSWYLLSHCPSSPVSYICFPLIYICMDVFLFFSFSQYRIRGVCWAYCSGNST